MTTGLADLARQRLRGELLADEPLALHTSLRVGGAADIFVAPADLAALMAQLEANLVAHELVKVKLLKNCPLEPDACAAEVEGQTGAALAQSVGRTLLFYRAHPEAPVLQLPAGRTG